MKNNNEECYYNDGMQNLIGYVNDVLVRETRDTSFGASTTVLGNYIVGDV